MIKNLRISFESFDLKDYSLRSFAEQYKDLMDTWKSLDLKAQGNVTIAGIFLAAAFTWTRNSQPAFSMLHKYLLISAIVLLFVSVAIAIFALFVKKVKQPPFGTNVYEMIRDLESIKINGDHIKKFKNDEIKLWETTIKSITDKIAKKGYCILFAQLMLLAAAFIFIYLTFLIVFNEV